MKIKATQNYVNAVTGEVFRIGHEYVVSDEHATEYVNGQLAEAVEIEPVAPEEIEAVEPIAKKSRKAK